MKIRLFLSASLALTALLSPPAGAVDFYPISGVTLVESSEFFPLDQLVQGSGVGFEAADPHNRLGNLEDSTWVTDRFAPDYFFDGGITPIITFDLGSDVLLSEISTWGYTNNHGNSARAFSLRFATDAEGTDPDTGFGTSITYNPSFVTGIDPIPRNSNAFSENVTARYVELTITDNWLGFGGVTNGGDRVGLGEVAFEDPPAGIQIVSVITPVLAFDVTTDFSIPVTNNGAQDLILSLGIPNFTGPNAAAFTVLFTPSPIGSMSAENIDLQFDPSGLGGVISATLHIESNDPETPTSEVLISALLPEIGPDISVPAEAMIVGDSSPQTLIIPIANLGRAQLNLTVNAPSGPDGGAFRIVSAPTSIAALSDDQIEIAFDPANLPGGPVDAILTIDSNDADTPTAEILFTGGVPYTFYPISSLTSATLGSDFFTADNLIQEIGTGFDSDWPHDALGGGESFLWVTNGNGSDYFDSLPDPAPMIVIDLGADVALSDISYWGYVASNNNGTSSFALRFATDTDGSDGFGTSISYNPTFAVVIDSTPKPRLQPERRRPLRRMGAARQFLRCRDPFRWRPSGRR